MIKIAIVDDEKSFQNKMHEYIRRFETETGEKITVTLFQDGLDILDNYKAEWDIILMDIKMNHMDGMSAAEKIRNLDKKTIIIFITTMAKYAIKGYEVDALDFVVKPINYAQFSTKMKKAVNMVKRMSDKKYLLLPFDERKERVSTDEILYIEVNSHNLYVVTDLRTYTLRYSMSDMEKELKDCHFARCNQSYLVNLKNVTGLGKDDVRIGEHKLPFSRSKKKQFLKELSDYLEAGY